MLIVICEPEAMIFSAYKQYVRCGGAQSLVGNVPPRLGGDHVPGFRFGFLEYARLFSYYQALFGGSRVLGLPYEMFAQQPAEYVTQITGFCDLKPNRRPWRICRMMSGANAAFRILQPRSSGAWVSSRTSPADFANAACLYSRRRAPAHAGHA